MNHFNAVNDTFEPDVATYLNWLQQRGLIWIPSNDLSQQSDENKTQCDRCHEDVTSLMAHFACSKKPRLIVIMANDFGANLEDFATNSETSNPELRLLQKMIAAIKVPLIETLIIDHQQRSCSACCDAILDLTQPECVLVFGGQVLASLIEPGTTPQFGGVSVTKLPWSLPTIATHSPTELLRTPQLKREAWQHLQIAMSMLQHAAKPGVETT